jgi:hypothetical protein
MVSDCKAAAKGTRRVEFQDDLAENSRVNNTSVSRGRGSSELPCSGMHYEVHDAHLTIDTGFFAKGCPTVENIKTGTETLPILLLFLTYTLLASLMDIEQDRRAETVWSSLKKRFRGRARRVCGAEES